MADDRLYPAYGDLNPVEEQRTGRTLDTRNTKPTDVLKEAALAVFKKDTYENSGPLKGFVLRIDNNPNNHEPDSWLSRVFGSGKPYSLKVLKVRIPEIHAALPEPSKYGANAKEANKVIDMYPSFIAASEEISNKPVAPGDIVLVDFVNRVNLTQPIYLGPVISNASPGAVGQKSGQKIFDDNGSSKLAASPPSGDNLLGNKNISNQIPQSIETTKEKFMPTTMGETTNGVLPDPLPAGFDPVSVDELKRIMSKATDANIQKYLSALNAAMAKYQMNTPKRQAAFLSQIAVESAQLKFDTELPSSANGFDFSKYENRKNLGNNQPGDGAKFKGRGLIQLTGRYNYTAMTKKLNALGIAVNLIDNPEIAARADISALIAAQYFEDHNINKLADTGAGGIVAVSRAVNGGDLGLQQRINFYNIAITVLA